MKIDSGIYSKLSVCDTSFNDNKEQAWLSQQLEMSKTTVQLPCDLHDVILLVKNDHILTIEITPDSDINCLKNVA